MQNLSPAYTPMVEMKLKKISDGYIYDPQILKDYQTLLGKTMHLIFIICSYLTYFLFWLIEFNNNLIDKY